MDLALEPQTEANHALNHDFHEALHSLVKDALLNGMTSSAIVAITASFLGGMAHAVERDGANPEKITASIQLNMEAGARHAREAFAEVTTEFVRETAEALKAAHAKRRN